MLVPGSLEGYSVTGISKPMVESLYSEARLCYSASAFTAVVLCCRKLLMHIAVVKGAEEDKGFSYYAKFLLENHYVPPDAASWVKFIVEKGNQSNHEIMKSEREDAKLVLQFVGMLLKNVFEFPALSAKAVPPVPPKK
jgi:hypothetical protein